MATIYNIVIDQGSTFNTTVTLTNDDGSAVDLTNYTVSAQLRKSYYTSTKVDFTTSKVNATGEISLSLTAEQTAAIRSGRYVYDVEITSVTQTVRVLEGIVTVTPEVTQ